MYCNFVWYPETITLHIYDVQPSNCCETVYVAFRQKSWRPLCYNIDGNWHKSVCPEMS